MCSTGKSLIDAVNENIRNISLVLLALAVVLTFISFALINNTIRLAIYSKRFLIHTMKLVGASWGFIQGPFLRRNVWSGILAGMLADAILMGTAYWAVTYEQEPDSGDYSGSHADCMRQRIGVRGDHNLAVRLPLYQ